MDFLSGSRVERGAWLGWGLRGDSPSEPPGFGILDCDLVVVRGAQPGDEGPARNDQRAARFNPPCSRVKSSFADDRPLTSKTDHRH